MEILFKTLNPKSIYEKMDAVEVLTAETIKNLNTKILEALMRGSLNTDMEFMSESNALLDKIKEVKITLEIKNAEPNFFLDQEVVQDFYRRMIKKIETLEHKKITSCYRLYKMEDLLSQDPNPKSIQSYELDGWETFLCDLGHDGILYGCDGLMDSLEEKLQCLEFLEYQKMRVLEKHGSDKPALLDLEKQLEKTRNEKGEIKKKLQIKDDLIKRGKTNHEQ